MKKKVISVLLATAMVAAMAACGSSDGGAASSAPAASSDAAPAASSEAAPSAEAPAAGYELEQIRMVVNGTLTASVENGQAEFEKQWEDAVGVDLVIEQLDHSGYVDAVGRIFASGDYPDVMIMSADMYAQYAPTGILWDMTTAYDNAEFQARMAAPAVNESLKIGGKLFGFAPAYGNGCVTFVKEAWLEAVGLTADSIKTWDDYYNMLTKFTNEDPDGNGANDTYGVVAAGFVGFEAPYINYLPEFWQDAYPAFTQDANGVWYDGFNTDATKAALLRLQKAYQDGVIDPESLTMGTKDARTKYWSADQAGSAGAFTYWAGTWNQTIVDNLAKNGVDDRIVTLAPIAEVGAYLDREAPVWVIIDDQDGNNDREQAIFDKFIDTMMDGDVVETLWVYGAEGVHWSTAAETFSTTGDNATEYSYEEGQFHLLLSPNDSSALWKKNHLDPAFVVCPLTNGFVATTDITTENNAFFVSHSKPAPKSASSETLTNEGSIITEAITQVVTEVVTKGGDVEEWMQTYADTTGSTVEVILTELNTPAE
jgi:multiple sugar transport system substrate-binding protein/putative aldouronate transport system substrate-binding protein